MIIDYNQISKMLFHAHSTDMASDGTETTKGGKLHITLADGKTLKFSHNYGNHQDIKDLLTQLMGDRLKYKR